MRKLTAEQSNAIIRAQVERELPLTGAIALSPKKYSALRIRRQHRVAELIDSYPDGLDAIAFKEATA
jgi:hypothetical protein